MTDQQISAIINALRYTNRITPLQKDILDTWDTLHKNPFDTDSAHKQILSSVTCTNANFHASAKSTSFSQF